MGGVPEGGRIVSRGGSGAGDGVGVSVVIVVAGNGLVSETGQGSKSTKCIKNGK